VSQGSLTDSVRHALLQLLRPSKWNDVFLCVTVRIAGRWHWSLCSHST